MSKQPDEEKPFDGSDVPDISKQPELPTRRRNNPVLFLAVFSLVAVVVIGWIIKRPLREVPSPKHIIVVEPKPPGAPPPLPWAYKPDGLEAPKELPVAHDVTSIPLRPAAWRPVLHSPFIALVQPQRQLLFDVRGDEKIGDLFFGNHEMCVSPWGSLYAQLAHNRIEVKEFGAGGAKYAAVLDIRGLSGNNELTFAGKDRLLVAGYLVRFDRKGEVKVVEEAIRSPGCWALTSTGRHLAILAYSRIKKDKWVVSIIDLDGEKIVGRFEIPGGDGISRGIGMAFSRDGAKLCCGLTEYLDKQSFISLFFFDLVAPKHTKTVRFKYADVKLHFHPIHGERLVAGMEWLSTGDAVLVGGSALVDYEMEKIVWHTPRVPLHLSHLPRLYNDNRVAVLASTREGIELRLVPVPLDEVARLRAEWAAPKGGKDKVAPR